MDDLNLLGRLTSGEKRVLISELLADANSLRVMVLRLENQILRNEAQVETLLAMRDGEPRDKKRPNGAAMSVPRMVSEALPCMPKQFVYSQVIEWCVKKYPAASLEKVKRGVYATMCHLKNAGAVAQAKDGSLTVVEKAK